MNWGKGLITGMVIFMLFILGMCFYMFRAPDDDYDHQYYEKGLTYNQYYNKEMQVIKEHAQPLITISDNYIFVRFKDPAVGTMHLQRPADVSLDKAFQFNSGKLTDVQIDLKTVIKGRWQLIFDWKSGDNLYAYQKEITIK